MFSNHAPFYPFGIDADIVYEITINEINKVFNATELRNWNFGLKNICLEYDTVSDMTLSTHIVDSYTLGSYYLYNYITNFKTVEISEEFNIFNTNINIPRRSMTGVLVIFYSLQANGKRDSELFSNPGILSVDISIEGIANKVYAQGLKPHNQWSEIKKVLFDRRAKEI